MVDKSVAAAIKKAVYEVLDERLDAKLAPLTKEIRALRESLDSYRVKLDSVEKSVEDSAARVATIETTVLPALVDHFNSVACGLAQQTLDIDVHRRKWSLVLQGLDGRANEDAETTRRVAVDFARTHLKVGYADATRLAACHRLKPAANAGMIIRFNDLAERNHWLASAKNLKDTGTNVSISPDLPPVLRPLKTELLKCRRDLPDAQRKLARIRHLPRWPYVDLKLPEQDPIRPSTTMTDIVSQIIEFPLMFNLDSFLKGDAVDTPPE